MSLIRSLRNAKRVKRTKNKTITIPKTLKN